MLLKAIEEKTFYPFGSDRQVVATFSLSPERCAICVSWLPRQIPRRSVRAAQSLDLHPAGLLQRQEDIEPNLDYEVERHAHSLVTACVLTPKRGAPGWPCDISPGNMAR